MTVNATRLLVESGLSIPLLCAFLWAGLPGPASFIAVVGSAFVSAIGDTAYVGALRAAGQATAFPVTSSIPAFGTFGLAVVLFGEPISPASGLGAFAIAVGVWLVVRSYLQRGYVPAKATRPRGLLLAALAGTLWTAEALLLRFGLEEAHPVGAAGLWGVVHLVMAVPALIATRPSAGSGRLPPLSTPAMLAGIASAASTFFYISAVSMAGAGRAVVLGLTSPLFGVVLAVLLLRERVRWQLGVGAVLAVAGAVLVV